MQRLGLIVGGVQKAGTSSLFGYLRQHPQLLAPSQKELHVFDDPAYADDPQERIVRYFDLPDDGRVPFEVTPIYLFWPGAMERIRAYNPDIRLVFIFRDPIERAVSHWRMETERGDETLSFGEAIRSGRQRMQSGDDRALRVFSYVERGWYGAQVARLLGLFPREQLLFLRARDLAEDRARTLDRIARFAGMRPFPILTEQRVRQSAAQGQIPPADAAYLRSLFRDDILLFALLSEVDVSDWPTLDEQAPLWRPSLDAGR